MIFKNKNFKKRDYETTNIIACVAKEAPSEIWIESDNSILKGLNKLWVENDVEYWGFL